MKFSRTHLKSVYQYYKRFSYDPTFTEIHLFYPVKISEEELRDGIDQLIQKREMRQIRFNRSISYHNSPFVYTPMGYSMTTRAVRTGRKIAEKKLSSIRTFIRFISIMPSVKLVGLSGSLSMHSAEKKDDIDLFVIASKHRMWTLRLVLNVLCLFIGKKRPRNVEKQKAEDKICLNMFFDETVLRIPKNRQNTYIAHELLQMKPIINYDDTHRRMIHANTWVKKLFPNAEDVYRIAGNNWIKNRIQVSKQAVFIRKVFSHIISFILISYVFNYVEWIAKYVQLHHMRGQITSETIRDGQLWFFKKYDLE